MAQQVLVTFNHYGGWYRFEPPFPERAVTFATDSMERAVSMVEDILECD